MSECPTCLGSGTIDLLGELERECSRCDGTGEVSSDLITVRSRTPESSEELAEFIEKHDHLKLEGLTHDEPDA